MGEGTDGLKTSAEEIEREVVEIRDRMEPVIDELDRRRQRLVAWKDRVRQNAPTVAKIGLVLIAALVVTKVVQGFWHRADEDYLLPE